MTGKRFSHHWPIGRIIHRSAVDFPHEEPVICISAVFLLALTTYLTNSRVADALRRHGVHVMSLEWLFISLSSAYVFLIFMAGVVHHSYGADIDTLQKMHEDVIKWKQFPRYWPFVRVIHRSPVNSPNKDQWRGALMFTLICARINGWVNNRAAGDLRRHCAHYDVILMCMERKQGLHSLNSQPTELF